MLWVAFIVVAIFIWLIFTNPFTDLVVRDTYETYFDRIQNKDQKKES